MTPVKTPVNNETLRQHLTYSWWKYVIFAVVAIFGVDLLYTTTAYRSPPEKKVDTYIYGYADEAAFQSWVDTVHAERMSDMEEMQVLLLTSDPTYGPMQLTTYIAASEGDIYILPRDNYVNLASQGAFIPLEEDQELLDLFSNAGISLQSGWRRETDTGENHLYGIPVSKLPGLKKYVAVENGFLSILFNCGNEDNCLKFLRILCEEMMKEPAT